MVPPPEEREEAAAAFDTGEREVQRRSLLKWMAMSVAAVFAAMVVSVFRSLASPPYEVLYDTVWKRGQRLVTIDGKPISAAALDVGTMVVAFPDDQIGSERAQTVLVRVRPEFLRLPDGRANWAPMGYLAYSRVCTHAGCPVGMYETTTKQLMCPCHQSTFSVLDGAKPTGGPADRPLPQLPLYIDDQGYLCAGDGFSGPPGPGFWGMPS
jgi:ubiquinol-cytochrome c reductase iron-sulfur subunit